jgi:formylglycine-generating enzyme required for sulfatase activity/serine/threonine protein kinase
MTMDPDLTVPRTVTRAGEYDLIRRMGSGGFGVVFEARHRKTRLTYAVKRIDLSAEDAKRFENEALYPAKIASQSLHVLGVQDFFHDPGQDAFYLVTELVPHGDLRRFLDTQPKPLPAAQALHLAIGIAKGLAAIHAQGIIHRDLKPANVLMDRKDDQWVPKIADFGLARSERSVSIGEFATSGYAAPEQMDLLSDQSLGSESDLFAFGMLLYELLTGAKATAAQDLREYGRWIGARTLPPVPSAVRAELATWPELDALVVSLLQFDRSQRLASAPHVVKTLNQVLRSVEREPPIPKPEPAPVPKPTPEPVPFPVPTPQPVPSPLPEPQPVTDPKVVAFARRVSLVILSVVFACTGAAMTFGMPSPGQSGRIPAPLWQYAGAPWYAVASWAVLPALFGLTIAVTLRLGAARSAFVSLLSVAAYQLAIVTPSGFATVGRRIVQGLVLEVIVFAGVAAAGVVGALIVLASIARWYRPPRRTIVLTAAAGAVGTAIFLILFKVPDLNRLQVAWAFIVWQMLVGLVIVDKTPLAAEKKYAPIAIRPIGAVFALALALCAVGSWVRSWPVPLKAGQSELNTKGELGYVWIPPGDYQMGCSPDDGECDADEQPSHKVTLTKGFWLGSTEVTVKSFRAVMGTDKLPPVAAWGEQTYNPNWANEQMPIVNVTWQEARDYCRTVDGRLPTEAEWEYAARARTAGARHGRIKEIARYSENSGANALSTGAMSEDDLRKALLSNRNTVQNVGGMSANAWGLEDMLGNAAEWVEDDYDKSGYSSASAGVTDPRPYRMASGSASKVVRGGSWARRANAVRSSFRGLLAPGERSIFVGFRCVWDGPANP